MESAIEAVNSGTVFYLYKYRLIFRHMQTVLIVLSVDSNGFAYAGFSI